jgi:putative ATPase
LTHDELLQLLNRALAALPSSLEFNEEAKAVLLHMADGDARRFLNLIEQTFNAAKTSQISNITAEFLEQSLGHLSKRFDKSGDHFYDQISALHKSVRGSNSDGALYWFCRMIDGGVDVKYLSRRIVRMAWEDIGLADPRAMQLANDAALTYERLGSPEGELALAEALIYLCAAPKSNAAYKAFNQAKDFVTKDTSRDVPMHLRNAPTKLMDELGHGKAYRYAHDEAHAYAAGENYLPDGVKEANWYQPTDRGLEAKIKEKLAFLKSLDEAAKNKK